MRDVESSVMLREGRDCEEGGSVRVVKKEGGPGYSVSGTSLAFV